MIDMQGNEAVLLKDVAEELENLYVARKDIEEREEVLKKELLYEMEELGVSLIKDTRLTVSYTPAKTKESFNKKKFEEENKLLYDKYVTSSFTKPSITIRMKER